MITEINRRHFLKGLGLNGLGISLALPSLESFAQGPAAPATRFVAVAPNYGMNPEGFFPTTTGSDYAMPHLLTSLESHRDHLTILRNMDHPEVGGGHGASNTFLNGVEMKDVKDNPQKLHSLDQYIAEKIGSQNRFPSLLLGSGGTSWSRAGIRLPSDLNPEQVFAKLFINDNDKVKASTRRYIEEDNSILDVVLEDAKRLNSRLSKTDQDKLDQYFTSIREVEKKLNRQVDWIDIDKPGASDQVLYGDDDSDVIVDLTYPYNTDVMYDLIVLALQTDSTRVASYGHPGGNRLFPFEGITMGYHSLTHHGKRPDLLKELWIIEKFYADQFARFLTKMQEAKDAEGRPLLDTTTVLFGSGMGNASSHSSRNLPIMVAGGGLKHGQHHTFEREGRDGRPLCDLYVTLLQQLGIEDDSFSTSTGNLNHLLT